MRAQQRKNVQFADNLRACLGNREKVRLPRVTDLPRVFHPAATGARLVFTPIEAG